MGKREKEIYCKNSSRYHNMVLINTVGAVLCQFVLMVLKSS